MRSLRTVSDWSSISSRAWSLLSDPNLRHAVRPSIPILYFGDLDDYQGSPLRVITVGSIRHAVSSRVATHSNDSRAVSASSRTTRMRSKRVLPRGPVRQLVRELRARARRNGRQLLRTVVAGAPHSTRTCSLPSRRIRPGPGSARPSAMLAEVTSTAWAETAGGNESASVVTNQRSRWHPCRLMSDLSRKRLPH